MNFDALFADTNSRVIRCGLVGIGDFGTSLLAQVKNISNIEIKLICDQNRDRLAAVIKEADIDAQEIAVVQDMDDAADVNLDILVEATGNPEVAARVGEQAIERGQHLVMVSKEASIVVGPILHVKAKAKGLVYTEVDGDQPSLLVGLMSWAKTIGLDVHAAGKSSEYDFILDHEDTLIWKGQRHKQSGLEAFWDRNHLSWQDLTRARRRTADTLKVPTRTVPDFCEMGVVTNATGFSPDRSDFHTPILRPVELAEALKRVEEGGLMSGYQRLDVFNCLRRPDELSFAGGVFILVGCQDNKTWNLLRDKGHIVAEDIDTAILYNPQHLLGIEAPMTILSAALLGVPTGATNPTPKFDLVARTERDFAAGEVLKITDPHHHEVAGLKPELIPAMELSDTNPCPYYLATGERLNQDVPAGSLVKSGILEINTESTLFRLRREQDLYFNLSR